MRRIRRNVFFGGEQARRLDEMSAQTGASKSSIVDKALADFFSPEQGRHAEAALARRLDRLSRQCERVERDLTILTETTALFIRHSLALAPAFPEEHLDAMRAQGQARFAQFIEQLARQLQDGSQRMKDLVDERVLHEDDLFAAPRSEDVAEKE